MKVAVLGLGAAGLRHAQNLLELGHDVIGFDPARLESLLEFERAPTVAAALDAVEAVIVASPSSHHAEQALATLAQRKHVLVEKPLAVTIADAERVVQASDRAAVVCGVAMNLRFHPGLLSLKRLIEDRTLGRVHFAQASFGYDLRLWHPGSDYRRGYSARADLGGGVLLDAIHELDYLLWLFGPVERVSAEVAHVSDLEIDVEDAVVAVLRFDSGALGSLDLNFFEPAYRRTCVVVGSEAVARWDWQTGTVEVRREGEADRLEDVRCDLAATYRAELVDFLEAAEVGGEVRTAARDGLAAVQLATAIKHSASLGQRIS